MPRDYFSFAINFANHSVRLIPRLRDGLKSRFVDFYANATTSPTVRIVRTSGAEMIFVQRVQTVSLVLLELLDESKFSVSKERRKIPERYRINTSANSIFHAWLSAITVPLFFQFPYYANRVTMRHISRGRKYQLP